MALEEEPGFGPPVTGPEHVATLVKLVQEGALDPLAIGDTEVRGKVLALLAESG